MNDLADEVSLDLEIDQQDRLRAIGAVRGEREHQWSGRGDATRALKDLDRFAAGTSFIVGHNAHWHDLPWLRRHAPQLRLLRAPAVDTLLLSALAFAEHPYHALLKDYKLTRESVNDPLADARIALRLLGDARQRLRSIAAGEPVFGRALHALALAGARVLGAEAEAGMALAFAGVSTPSENLDRDVMAVLGWCVCRTALLRLLPEVKQPGERQLAFLLAFAWLRVAGTIETTTPSIVMPWARKEVPQLTPQLAELRDRPCSEPGCAWCRSVHDATAQLRRWFGYESFRSEPALASGRSVQEAVVEAGLADRPHLALLPTGGGKSLCFQLPAIARYQRRGSLTIVISPLQALMRDQVENLRNRRGFEFAFALTGLLSAPERRETLDAVRTGRAGILYVSPEQLRNRTFRAAIARREIGAWVFDEVHCLSKWGHDFRPDYLYAARFIREFSEEHKTPPAPVAGVTATARPGVCDEIVRHFQEELAETLEVFDGHAERRNLMLRMEETAGPAKEQRLLELVAESLAHSPNGSVLVYTATRATADDVAAVLRAGGIEAESFHAGLEPPRKKDVQDRFVNGELRVVCATNAFGMGIDKPDIRRVVHFAMPGSLESYVQEVGRAGRDGRAADAVLLFAKDDVETQFRLAASSRLDLADLRGILRRVRFLARSEAPDAGREAVCTTGEILRDEELRERIEPTDRNAPTRVVTALAWLERGKFLSREENATTVFQGRPLVKTITEARHRIAELQLKPGHAEVWLAILGRLMNAEVDDGLSSDDFLELRQLDDVLGEVTASERGRAVLRTLVAMQKAQLLLSGVRMTAFVRAGVTSPSEARLKAAMALEDRILELLREQVPHPGDERHPLVLTALTQELAGDGTAVTLDQVRVLLMAAEDRGANAGRRAPGLRLSFTSRDHCHVTVRGDWDTIVRAAQRRHALASVCLATMLGKLPEARSRGASLLVEFTLEELVEATHADLDLRAAPSPDPTTEIEYALLFLHRVHAIVLHKGLAVFRQAMVLRVPAGPLRKYGKDDFARLHEHQEQRTLQVHVMHEFARTSAADPARGQRLLDDYFRLPEPGFLRAWFPDRKAELQRATSPESWDRIVNGVNDEQRRIVQAPEQRSLLVLAGPGSGKTRVVVHRCAFLLRVARVPARAILVLCYNRSAAIELRTRLRELVGDDARGVLVQTFHGMAALLAGSGPAPAREGQEEAQDMFDHWLRSAVEQLEAGNTVAGESEGHDDLRERLLAGFRHILVDEYQDIDEWQYRLVSAIAGRTLQDDERKLTVLAVGDDNQNIYQWRHSDVAFLRRFEADYRAERVPLLENHRSTAHIVAAANQVIAVNPGRMKQGEELRVNAARAHDPRGGRLEAADPLARGRVHVLEVGTGSQPHAALAELRRLQACDPAFDWGRAAVLSSRHAPLDAVRALCEDEGMPVRHRIDHSESFSLFRLREVQGFLHAVEAIPGPDVDGGVLRRLLAELRSQRPRERTFDLVDQGLTAFLEEHGENARPKVHLREFLGELLLEQRHERTLGEGLMLSTVHGSKGMEYDHVMLLDGGFSPRNSTLADQRCLYYVGMTRARHSLTLLQAEGGAPWVRKLTGECIHRMRVATGSPTSRPVRYDVLGPGDLWVSFAGRAARHEETCAAIDRLVTGDPLQLVDGNEWLFLHSSDGARTGALSKAASARWRDRLPRIESVRVAAIVIRCREDEGPDYREQLGRDRWPVVIAEVKWLEQPSAPP